MSSIRFVFALCFAFFSVASAVAADPIKTTVLSELDRFEGFDAHLFHAGYLWVGRSRLNLGGYYRLEVYDATGKQVANLELKHSLRQIAPFGQNAVIVVGVSAEPNVSQYTVVSAENGKFPVANHPVPETAWADRFVGSPKDAIFSDPGGNQDDPGLQTNPNQPAQTLFRLVNGEPHYLSTRLPLPTEGLVLGGKLYLVQDKDISGQQSNLVRVDLKTEKVERLFNDFWRQGLSNLTLLSDGTLALVERGAGQLLVVDPAAWKLTATIKVEAGTPHGLAQLGSCLVVGSETTKRVSFYDLKDTAHARLALWDLSGAGAKLLGIRNLAADPQSGRVYVRSAYACNPLDTKCGPDRNSVVMAEETSGATFKQCQK